jgi:Domain of unknown function (DUF4351)
MANIFNRNGGFRLIQFRTYALRSPNPLRKGALDVPPFLRGVRGDRGFRLQCVSPIDMIEETDERQNISACVQVLAGLRFDKSLIKQLFREEIMQESVIYQDILQKGLQQGLQQGEERGKKQEALQLILRQLTRRFNAIEPEMQQQIRTLSITQLEELAEALLDFNSQSDLVNYLANISLPQPNQED